MLQSKLRTVLGTRGPTAALKDGLVRPVGFEFDFDEEVTDVIGAFRRMVRNSEFDVCEMALSTYLCAREHGKRFTALPVFLVRAFHHSAILVRRDNSARSPKALEGQRVGVAGGYTTTTGLWARALLQEEHGVDLGRVTWVLSGDEHVAGVEEGRGVCCALRLRGGRGGSRRRIPRSPRAAGACRPAPGGRLARQRPGRTARTRPEGPRRLLPPQSPFCRFRSTAQAVPAYQDAI